MEPQYSLMVRINATHPGAGFNSRNENFVVKGSGYGKHFISSVKSMYSHALLVSIILITHLWAVQNSNSGPEVLKKNFVE